MYYLKIKTYNYEIYGIFLENKTHYSAHLKLKMLWTENDNNYEKKKCIFYKIKQITQHFLKME